MNICNKNFTFGQIIYLLVFNIMCYKGFIVNKIIKTLGFTTALSGAVLTSAMGANCNTYNTNSPRIETVSNNTDDDNTGINLLETLVGLGIVGMTGVFLKKINDFKNIPYSQAHFIINESCYVANKDNKYKRENVLKTLDDNQYKLYKLLNTTKIYDRVAAEQCKFTYGAIRHAVLHNENVDNTLKIKTQYLFDKAVSPKKYFKKLHQQYIEENPLIDFDKNYGHITLTKYGIYTSRNEPLIYEGLRNKVVANELTIMLKNIQRESGCIPFYVHDKENLISKINRAAYYIRRNETIPHGLLTEINDIYHTKYLRKNIDIK